MGKRGKTTGVQRRGDTLRIYFRWPAGSKQTVFEKVPYPPTATGIREAALFREEVVRRIRLGAFNYAEFFPDSPRAERRYHPTFYECAADYLRLASDNLAKSTLTSYRKYLDRCWIPYIGDTEIQLITTLDLREAIASYGFESAKTHNNALTPMKKVFGYAEEAEHISRDPSKRIKSRKVQSPEPDPLDLAERDAVLKLMKKRWPKWLPYFQLAFGTGMRPSEIIELKWSDIDWINKAVLVQRARVEKSVKNTKTYKSRNVELSAIAISALKAQKSLTYLNGDLVFLDPGTGKPINDDKPPRLVWNACLKAAGVRRRNAYNARHTYATLALMSGANPMWVAKQLGHANMGMLLKRYSKWIEGADTGSEIDKVNAVANILANRVRSETGTS